MTMMTVATTTPSRHRLGGFPGFALVSLGLIGAGALALSLAFPAPGDRFAILLSAVIAWTTQVAAFPAVKRMVVSNLIVGWAVGSLVRMGTLLIYAVLGIFVFKLSMTPALLGLALFYFVSMVIEPLFLRS
jgi:hypothetical protein